MPSNKSGPTKLLLVRTKSAIMMIFCKDMGMISSFYGNENLGNRCLNCLENVTSLAKSAEGNVLEGPKSSDDDSHVFMIEA